MPVVQGSSMVWYKERKSLGLCTSCDNPRLPSTSRCSECLILMREEAKKDPEFKKQVHKTEEGICAQCFTVFQVRPGRKFCSRKCYHESRITWTQTYSFICEQCGIEIEVTAHELNLGIRRFCGQKCSWDSQTHPIGHKTLQKSGYVSIKIDEGKWRLEHTVIMEQIIGRSLVEKEEVHHMNGVRHDNRIENLELWSTSQPPGQRVDDKVKWAKEIISLYEPEALK